MLSIAYDEPLAVLDGNVARVLARLGAVRGDLRQPTTWRSLSTTAARLLDTAKPGTWNQAMMELGATVCTPRAPRCGECPVSQWCRARALGIVDDLPESRVKPAKVRITLAAAVLLDPSGRTFVLRHVDSHGDADGNAHADAADADARGVLFSRLWQFPATLTHNGGHANAPTNSHTEKTTARTSHDTAQQQLARHLAQTLNLREVELRALPIAKHAVTFRDIRLAPFLVHVGKLPSFAEARTPRLADLDSLPVSSATRKIAAAALRAV